ncbi:MAG: radical SAM protein [Candidatus Omnitrophota bacterium]
MNFMKALSGEEIIERIKAAGAPVIIFGAGVAGEALYYACLEAGIKIASFCDNNINKVKFRLCDTKVVHTRDLKARYKDALFLISAADIQDVISQLRDLGLSKWYPASPLLRGFDAHRHKFSAPLDFVEYAVATCILCQESYLDPDKLFLRSLDIIVTERCSLKCVNCSNLMQYYGKPVDCGINELMLSIGRFCDIIDEINEFRVIGGEPFMNKDFHLIVKRLVDEPKAKKVVVYTNGTIVPAAGQMEPLKSEKVLFIITDYGKLSRNLDSLASALKQNRIAYYVQKAQGWTDCAKIIEHHRTEKEQKELFRNCCAKNTFTLSDAKLYRCPFSANCDRLRAVPAQEDDSVDIFRYSGEGKDTLEAKNRIRAFLTQKQYLGACDYCNGRPFTASEITPAVQTPKPLEYDIKQK